MKTSFLRKVVISIAILVVMVLFSACSGLGNGQSTLTGSIVSVNASTGTVVIKVGSQQDTITQQNLHRSGDNQQRRHILHRWRQQFHPV